MKKTVREFFEINGKGTFLKVKANAFDIGKVLLCFVKFDDANKSTASIDIYVNISEILLVCEQILNDTMAKKAKKSIDTAKEQDSKYPKCIWEAVGGTSAKKTKRADGKPSARRVQLSPGSMQPLIFTADEGVGKEEGNGLISFVGKPEKTIRVPLTGDVLRQFAIAVKMEYSAWLTGKYARREFDEEYATKQ